MPALFPKDEACQIVAPDPSRPPLLVDIIMAVDNSGNMVEELGSVQTNINPHFAAPLGASGVDYRVILLSDYGKTSDKAICIPAPLGGSTCTVFPSKPANTARFYHYDVKVDGLNSLSLLLSTYDLPDVNLYAPTGWKDWLRTDALGRESLKAFVEISGGDSSLVAAEFESALLAKTPARTFGDATHPNNIFHSIVGVGPNTPPTEPWLSTDPITAVVCGTGVTAGLQYQLLSTSTGGLRFPVCDIADYGAAFEAIAADIKTATTVQCDFTPPPPADGQRYGRAYIEYTPTVGAVEQFLPVADLSACTATGFLRDLTTGAVALCPQACVKLRADATARVEVRYACVSSAGL